MEKIKEHERFRAPFRLEKLPEDHQYFLKVLIKWIEDHIYHYLATRINFLLGDTEIYQQPTGSQTRRGKIQTGGVAASAFTVKLLDENGAETGDNITVTARKDGTSDLDSGVIEPNYVATDIIPIYLDKEGNWRTVDVFYDVEDWA